jgi:hypothetical protein
MRNLQAMNLRRRTTCRVCGSSALKEVINLGEQHLQGSFVKEGQQPPPMRKIPCKLVRCCPEEDENACGLLQMRHSVPPEILYSTYWYRSATNQTMRSHLDGIVSEIMGMMEDNERGSALDIGCNDCTLLASYPGDWKRLGVDPSDIPHPPEFQVFKDLFPSSQLGANTFDVITSIAMFYDLEDPVAFARAIRQHLSDDGLWVVEMSYMPSMLELNSYDTICHEHLEYYSFAVIERICREANLKVVRAELNDSNGGSIRCYITHEGCTFYANPDWQAQIHALRVAEFDMELDTDAPYCAFQHRIDHFAFELWSLLQKLHNEGKRIHIYGASTKGNTILQKCGIAQFIECAADRNPEKWGAKTLGTGIPIISEEESRKMKPDYFLVLPWHFKKEFLEREKNSGGKMIFPLPTVEIIG